MPEEIENQTNPVERPKLEDLFKVIQTLLDEQKFDETRALVEGLHPAEVAGLMGGFGAFERNLIFDLVFPDLQHEVLAELEESDQEDVLERMTEERIGNILGELDSDDAADIAALLDEPLRLRVLAATDAEDREEVERLLGYDEETAGGLMAVELVTVSDSACVIDAVEAVREAREREHVEEIHYVYVVDKQSKLVGRISILEMMLAPRRQVVTEIMDPDMVVIHTEEDQEEVAQKFKRYDLISAPVVDSDNRLIGRITIDDILDVIEDEADEDISRLTGTEEEPFERNILVATRARLPWLIVAFLGELLSALVLAQYEVALSQLLIIAFFIPVVIAVAGNVGIQSSTIVVRGLGTGEIHPHNTFRKVLQEVAIGLINGTVIAAIFTGVIYLWRGDLHVALVVSSALVAVILIAAVTGATTPFLLKSMKQDPAHASGPFITMTNDVIGLAVYMIITTSFLLS